MFVLGIIPGMPHFVFLTIAAVLFYGAWVLANRPVVTETEVVAPTPPSDGEASWDDLQPVDQLGLELGYRLIAYATMMMLNAAPNHLVAMKTVMASVEVGISEYQEEKQNKDKK